MNVKDIGVYQNKQNFEEINFEFKHVKENKFHEAACFLAIFTTVWTLTFHMVILL